MKAGKKGRKPMKKQRKQKKRQRRDEEKRKEKNTMRANQRTHSINEPCEGEKSYENGPAQLLQGEKIFNEMEECASLMRDIDHARFQAYH